MILIFATVILLICAPQSIEKTRIKMHSEKLIHWTRILMQ
jgi:hypothetical protein